MGLGIMDLLTGQMKAIYSTEPFSEHMALLPGLATNLNRWEDSDLQSGCEIHNGSRIFVPENTAAVIFGENAIELVITEPGSYEYNAGTESFFSDADEDTILSQWKEKAMFNGAATTRKRIVFVNLREIRDIKFGTKGETFYRDAKYGEQLGFFAYGSFAIRITDPARFLRNFVPANVNSYSFDDPIVRSHLLTELLQSFSAGLSILSEQFYLAQFSLQTDLLRLAMLTDTSGAGTWEERYGFVLQNIMIENIEFSDRALKRVEVLERKYRKKTIVSRRSVKDKQKNTEYGPENWEQRKRMHEEQLAMLRQYKELLDTGVITPEEFEKAKAELFR